MNKTITNFSRILSCITFDSQSVASNQTFYFRLVKAAKKIGYQLLVLWGVVTVVFFLFNLTGSDPVQNLVGENANQEVVTNMRNKLRLNHSLSVRYLEYLNNLSPISVNRSDNFSEAFYADSSIYKGWSFSLSNERSLWIKFPSLGKSFISEKSVSSIFAESFPGTFVLALGSILLSLILGIPLGIWAYQKKDSWIDKTVLFVSAIGMAGPSFFVALIVAWIGAVLLRDYTGLSMTGSWYSVDVWEGKYIDLKNLILPMITLMIRPLAIIVQLTRSSMLDIMSQDFIRTARAKGLSERRVLYRHALPNALNPVVTAVSGWFASLLAGAVFVEFVFGWKGIGQELFMAIEKQDQPIVMGGVILVSAVFILVNVLVEWVYGILDPRIRTSSN
jgi:peptide/nickel transport system permease protein